MMTGLSQTPPDAAAISGFQAMVGLWIWCGIVVLHGLWRSFGSPDPDPIRLAGPID